MAVLLKPKFGHWMEKKIQKQIVIDWDDFGLRLYDHDEMAENIYYDSEKNFEN